MAGKPTRGRAFRWAVFGFLASAAVILGLAAVYFLGPTELPGRPTVLLIRPGEAAPAAARALEAEGLVRNARVFAALARILAPQGVRAGEFSLSSGWSAFEILRVIATTNGIQHRVAVREGLPWWTTAKLFEQEGLCDALSFEKAMHNATLLKKYGIPGDSAEGFLFPETYLVSRSFGNGGQAAVERMLREFSEQVKKLWPAGMPPAAELRRIVTLASLVERETGDPVERARIAGVFVNRLRVGMRLQSDPTTIYGMGPTFEGKLTRADLENPENPYNTYAHYGLPPGPICSPGLAALRAAIHPEANDFLYFVAKGDGTHEFSRTLEEHNAAVNRYQRHRAADYRSWPAEPEPAASAAAAPNAPLPAAEQAAGPEENVKRPPAKSAAASANPAPKSTAHRATAKRTRPSVPQAAKNAKRKHTPAAHVQNSARTGTHKTKHKS